jgi:GT2 family glycosyltransferase
VAEVADRERASVAPASPLELELAQPLELRAPGTALDGACDEGRALVRLHGRPLGLIELDRTFDRCDEDLAARVWSVFQLPINDHLRRDGLPQAHRLALEGLPAAERPSCHIRHEQLLRRPPYASVVVATRNRPTALAHCLSALLALTYPAYEVVVVDNDPVGNGAAKVVWRARPHFPRVRYVRERRAGLAVAHNAGVRAARGEILAFTDDDVVVERGWLTELVAPFHEDPRVGCVTGAILSAEYRTREQLWQEAYWRFNKGVDRRVYDSHRNRALGPLYPFAAGIFGSGANMAFRAAVLRDIGGFDPALGAGSPGRGGDDLAAFFEVLAAGYQLVYEPAAIVFHRHRRDYEATRLQAYGYGVGLAAYLTKLIVDRPRLFLTFARKAPDGIAHIFGPGSVKNSGRPTEYPSELTWLERIGMGVGPMAYLRGRYRRRALYS